MTEFVCRRTGRSCRVGDQLGGQGDVVVHAVEPASSDLVLKRYRSDALRQRPDLEPRLKVMIANPPAYRAAGSDHVTCAWPEDMAYVSGRFAGFVMPRVDIGNARTIDEVATASDTTWRDRVVIAENLARVVALLHAADVIVGDFAAQDLLVWPDHRVTLLGCDRMQVADGRSGRRFPCLPRGEGVTAPEVQHDLLPNTLRASSSDIFGLAVQLHLLLLGQHPFQGEWTGPGERPGEQVLARNGWWSYAGDPRLGPPPEAVPLHVLPYTLRRQFRATFVDGARNPAARPPVQEWLTELVRLRESLLRCAREPLHQYGHHLPGCPWCAPTAQPPASEKPAVGAGAHRRHAAVSSSHPDSVPAAFVPAEMIGPAPEKSSREPAPLPRRRRPRRITAWAAAVVAGIAAVIAVASATDGSDSETPGPAAAASTQTAATPLSSPSPTAGSETPTEVLERTRVQDAVTAEKLAESWVAQLSARPAESPGRDRSMTDAAILAGHHAVREQYPGAVLLWAPDWNYQGRFWITVLAEPFPTPDAANAWCDAHGFPARECHAKKLSHSGPVEGSARYRG
jgi:DNA-binding helix-hairpin-helix protein with protein kinase domain